MSTPHQIHFVIDTQYNGEQGAQPGHAVEMYATKFLPCRNVLGSRPKYWKVNLSLESRAEKAVVVSWDHNYTGQREQLAAALGYRYNVLTQWETLQLIGKSAAPVKPSDRPTLQPGILFDNSRGIYIQPLVIRLGIQYGFVSDFTVEQLTAVEFGNGPYEFYQDEADDSATYLQQFVAPGHWIGYNENGDFGIFPDGEI